MSLLTSKSRHLSPERALMECRRAYTLLKKSSHDIETSSHRLIQLLLSRQEEDRKEISRELHDEVAQMLTAVNFELAILAKHSSRSSEQLKTAIIKSQRMISQSVKTIHSFARRLRPIALDDLGLVPALRSYIRDLAKCSPVVITFQSRGRQSVLSEAQKSNLFRVAQEALTNVARHSHARRAKVKVVFSVKHVSIDISDNGIGFNPKKPGLGILGMQERMRSLGGTLEIKSQKRLGTQIQAHLPLGTVLK